MAECKTEVKVHFAQFEITRYNVIGYTRTSRRRLKMQPIFICSCSETKHADANTDTYANNQLSAQKFLGMPQLPHGLRVQVGNCQDFLGIRSEYAARNPLLRPNVNGRNPVNTIFTSMTRSY